MMAVSPDEEKKRIADSTLAEDENAKFSQQKMCLYVLIFFLNYLYYNLVVFL